MIVSLLGIGVGMFLAGMLIFVLYGAHIPTHPLERYAKILTLASMIPIVLGAILAKLT